MHLALQVLSLASLQVWHGAETKETNILNKRNIVKNPNWQEADQTPRDYRETNPASDRVEALNPGLPYYNTCALNHSATLPPTIGYFI